MKTIRVIQYSTSSGEQEGVYFTEDLESEAIDFVPPRMELDSDTIIKVSGWNDSFPMDYNLARN